MDSIKLLPDWALEGYLWLVVVLLLVIASSFLQKKEGLFERPGRAQFMYTIIKILAIVTAILGAVIGIIVMWEKAVEVVGSAGSFHIITDAHADTKVTAEKNVSLLPVIILGTFIVLMIAFLGSLYVVLTAEESKKNEKKIKFAADFVKVFGGFFIGIGTAYINQAIGS